MIISVYKASPVIYNIVCRNVVPHIQPWQTYTYLTVPRSEVFFLLCVSWSDAIKASVEESPSSLQVSSKQRTRRKPIEPRSWRGAPTWRS